MKIYTKTGDSGQTSLYGGVRVSKADARVEAYGTVDELNAFLGLAKAKISDENIDKWLRDIQYNLFTLGSEVATPSDKLFLANGKPRLELTINEKDITELEDLMDQMETELEPLRFFILPAGGEAAASLHVARTVCRRAERSLVFLNDAEPLRPELITYLNRLSDFLFVLARFVSKQKGENEEYWNPNER